MLRKISSSIIAFILSVGLFGNPILAEEQLPNSGGQGSGGPAPISEPVMIEPETIEEPIVIEPEIIEELKPGTGIPSDPVEPTPVEDRKYKIEEGPGRAADPVEPAMIEPNPKTTPEPEIIEPKNLEAVPTSSTIIIDGESVSFEAYLINGNNYFKLRDLAYILSEEKTAEIIETKNVSDLEIIKDITTVQFTAYLVNGDIYFKLRDLGAAFDFGVDWDGETNTVIIDTNKSYTTN